MPRKKSSTQTASVVPSNPILFLIALIRSRVAMNRAVVDPETGKPKYDTYWLHQTFAPDGQPESEGLRAKFCQAVREGILKFSKEQRDAAAGLTNKRGEPYASDVALFVVTMQDAAKQGLIIERQYGPRNWRVAVLEDLRKFRPIGENRSAAPQTSTAKTDWAKALML